MPHPDLDNETFYRKCDEATCEFPATYYVVWTKPRYYCPIHLQKVLAVADAMGFPTPAATVRRLTIDEMLPDED
jgi:hypothetical protein